MKHQLCPPKSKLTVILFCLAIFLCCCSSSYTVRSAGKPNFDYSNLEMIEELTGREANIELKDGRHILAKEVKIFDDSASWVDARTKGKSKASIRQINKIVTKSSSIGTLEGIGFGLVGGGGLGFLVGSTQHSREIPMELIGVILGGGTGTIVGLITGLIVGHSYNYEFPTTAQRDSLQNRK